MIMDFELATNPEPKVEELIDSLIRIPVKKFKCDTCSKYFSSKHCLLEHGYTHTKEMPYVCRLCEKPFRHASQLSLHKKEHSVKTEIFLPKLTDMLVAYKEELESPQEETEKIELPLIVRPQEFHLPRFSI